MNALQLLREHWSIWGLQAPRFAWVAAAFLLVVPQVVLIYFWWSVHRESKALTEAISKVSRVRMRNPTDANQGLTLKAYSELSEVFSKSASLKAPWNAFASLMVGRRNAKGEDRYWATDSAGVTFSDEAVLEVRLNRGFYNSIPGIVTGTGLLFTFLAILVALIDVRINNQTNQIEGLPLLIEGLSGKFVSSISALFSATIFLIFERPLVHKMSRLRLQLVNEIDGFCPRLTLARVLVDVQRDISEQSVAFRSFNADLSTKLKQGFSEGLGPTIQRMVNTIEDLNAQLRAAEAQKQESITGSVSGLIQSLQLSLTSSLETIGERFKEALSGSATTEFSRVTDTLGGTARLLETMNTQFMGTQAALTELVNLAKSSTVEQLALGKTQVQDLTSVLRQFMLQMNESAGASVRQMAGTLTAVVHDLSTKVAQFGSEMAESLSKNAERTSNAASVVVERADKWSSRSAEQLDHLVERLEAHSRNTKDIENTLMATLGLFNDSLTQYASLNAGLNKVAMETSAMAVASAGAANSATESQRTLQQISVQTGTQLERLAEANKRQQDIWVGIQQSMEQYKNAFAQTERSAADLLTQIAKHVDSHLEVTKRGYGEIVRIADEHFTQATRKLGASVDELDEHLQGLTDTLERFRGGGNGSRA